MLKNLLIFTLCVSINSQLYQDVQTSFTDILQPYLSEVETECISQVSDLAAILQSPQSSNGYIPDDPTTLTKDSFKQLLKDLKDFGKDQEELLKDLYLTVFAGYLGDYSTALNAADEQQKKNIEKLYKTVEKSAKNISKNCADYWGLAVEAQELLLIGAFEACAKNSSCTAIGPV